MRDGTVAAQDPGLEEQLAEGRRRRAPLGILRRRRAASRVGSRGREEGEGTESPTGREEAAPLPRPAAVRL